MKIARRRFLKYAISFGTLGLVASYPVFIERYIILINTYRIPVPNLPDEFKGFRIAHLTDLHYGFLVPLRIIENVVRRTNRLPKDMVVCTGDYVHERNSNRQIDRVWPVLSKLEAKQGVFSVLGNHDHWADTDRSLYWLERSGHNLRGSVRPIEKEGKRIWLVGGGDLWEDHLEFDALLRDVPDQECRIVLAHNPDSADTPFTVRTDLIISGHTHGGQVNLPFVGTPVLPVRNKNYSSGLRVSNKNESVFISKGIGWAIYPVRFNCFPEIAVLELVPKT
jgi:predicted MPP superfamily phosphohydrolase